MVYPTDNYIDLHAMRLHYLDWGNREKPPLVLLHGFMAHAHIWDEFAVSAMANYHTIALDQRGHGESQWSEDSAYTIYDHFLDISGFVEKLGLESFILMGHSMGGRNGLFYAACSPQKISKLILVDSRPGNNPMGSEALRRHLAALPLVASSLDEVGRAIQSLYPSLPMEICRSMVQHGYKTDPEGKYIPKYDRCMSFDSERSGYAVENLWPLPKNINCPTLIVRGKGSPFLSLEDAQKLARLIPQAEWREIPEATHLPMQENPSVFKQMIFDFLKRST